MKTFHSKLFQLVFPALTLIMLGFVSCKEDDEELEPMRMFQPGGEITAASSESSVDLTWKTPPNTVEDNATYTVEVAKDTLFQTPIVFSGVTDTTKITLTEEQLTVKEIYFARVKTNATEGSAGESKWLTSARFSIRGAQLFLDNPVKSEDLNDRAVRLKFISRPELTRVVLTPVGGGTPVEVALTPANLNEGAVIVDNLAAGTAYTAEIFAGTRSRGTTSLMTKEPLDGIVVDLRGFTERPGVLQDTLPQIPNGSTVILKRGMTYTISSTVNLDKSVTITSGSDLTVPGLASIYFTSNFNVTAGSNIDHLVFKDVNMSSNDATARYVFNINNASTIKTMLFDNVRASMFRGIVRLQSQPTIITDFTVNNSVLDSIGNYGVLTVDVATSQAQNIVISNSTIYKAEKVITSRNNSTSVLIENVTVNESPVMNQYLVDYSTSGTNNVTNGIKVVNTILGIGKAGNQSVKGVRANANTLVEAVNSYSTADYVLAPTSNFAIPGLSAYSGTSLSLWQDPKNGDFRFKDANFPGKASTGDPRWR
ncbi:DUF5123 domain-containing protein [Rufibacter psychrotolerans]|uniref:DUF5123 domain-containing protein n=1 Tax=Rufibacter psychrotolerans TaxID=2812556 RepID=UPI001F0821BA|nr:DUF5123 domain-containing protein [Rufibacter sp. SYSU D00308]